MLLGLLWGGKAMGVEEIRVMSFNLWHGGDAGGQPLEQSVAVIRAGEADVVGLQETEGRERDGVRPDHGRRLSEMLGWQYHDQGRRTGVASRFPILGTTSGGRGVRLDIGDGRRVTVFNVHLMHAPYQPYQLLGIPYHDAPFIHTAAEAVREAERSRGAEVDGWVEEVRAALERGETVFLTGDFNEPSHQDWTERAAAAGRCPVAVPFPATRKMTEAGLRDAYRAARVDEVAEPGWTWTPLTRPDDPKDRHDRIDFVFFGGPGVRLLGAEVVGEAARWADRVVQPYPSDHRAVVARFGWERGGGGQ